MPAAGEKCCFILRRLLHVNVCEVRLIGRRVLETLMRPARIVEFEIPEGGVNFQGVAAVRPAVFVLRNL